MMNCDELWWSMGNAEYILSFTQQVSRRTALLGAKNIRLEKIYPNNIFYILVIYIIIYNIKIYTLGSANLVLGLLQVGGSSLIHTTPHHRHQNLPGLHCLLLQRHLIPLILNLLLLQCQNLEILYDPACCCARLPAQSRNQPATPKYLRHGQGNFKGEKGKKWTT